MATIETGNIIPRYGFWNPATWAIPSLYWDTFSDEQRYHAICRELGKVIQYADYLGVNVDDIASRLKAIEDGQLDELITAEIEAWFNDNEPEIVAAIQTINETIGDGFSPENTITASVGTLSEDVGTLQGDVSDMGDTVSGLSDTVGDLGEDVTAIQTSVTGLDTRVSQLEQDNYAFEGWGGWETLLNANAFTAGRGISKSITEKNNYASSPENIYYSEIFYINAPMPFNNLNVAASTDRNCQTVVNTNPENHVGLQFRVMTAYNLTTPSDTIIRMILTGLIRKPRVNPTAVYNAVIGQQIGNLAMTYYQAMLDGRQFSYGRNFFYQSIPNDIINDSNGRGRMECDTFVGMILRGIPYEISPYSITTPDYTYDYADLYTDVSGASTWTANTAYSLGDLVVIDDYYYYECIQAHTSSSAFNEAYWSHVWISNPYSIAWATSENAAMHPANKYLGRDILFAGDIGFLGWLQDRVFSDPEQALTGDVAIWVRRANTPTYWGGTSQSQAFDNIGHVGIVYIENGQKYIIHVTSANVFEGTVVNKTPIEEFTVEQPAYYYRPLYS